MSNMVSSSMKLVIGKRYTVRELVLWLNGIPPEANIKRLEIENNTIVSYAMEHTARLKTIEEHEADVRERNRIENDRRMDVACPECGRGIEKSDDTIIAQGWESRRHVHCPKCSWKGEVLV